MLVCMLFAGCSSSPETPSDPVVYKPPPADARVSAVLLSASDLATTSWQVADTRRLRLPKCALGGIAAGSVAMNRSAPAPASTSASAPLGLPASAQDITVAVEKAFIFPTDSAAVAYYNVVIAGRCAELGDWAQSEIGFPKLADASHGYHYDSPDIPGGGIYVAIVRTGFVVVQLVASDKQTLLPLARTAVHAAETA
jgi:hypothetical protein